MCLATTVAGEAVVVNAACESSCRGKENAPEHLPWAGAAPTTVSVAKAMSASSAIPGSGVPRADLPEFLPPRGDVRSGVPGRSYIAVAGGAMSAPGQCSVASFRSLGVLSPETLPRSAGVAAAHEGSTTVGTSIGACLRRAQEQAETVHEDAGIVSALHPRHLFKSPSPPRYRGGSELNSASPVRGGCYWASPVRAPFGAASSSDMSSSPSHTPSPCTPAPRFEERPDAAAAIMAVTGVSPARSTPARRLVRSPSAPASSSHSPGGSSTGGPVGILRRGVGSASIATGRSRSSGSSTVAACAHRCSGAAVIARPRGSSTSTAATALGATAVAATCGTANTPQNLTDWRRSLQLAKCHDDRERASSRGSSGTAGPPPWR